MLGKVYTAIGAWDDAIAAFERDMSVAESIEDERLQKKHQGQVSKVYP